MASPAQLTTHQHAALQAIQAFVEGPGDCFLLQGGAGTGKTTLLAALAELAEVRVPPACVPRAHPGEPPGSSGTRRALARPRFTAAIYAFERLTVFEGVETTERPRFAVPLLS